MFVMFYINNKMYRTTKVHSAMFNVCILGLAKADLCTKYEISTLTHYRYERQQKNAEIWMVRG